MIYIILAYLLSPLVYLFLAIKKRGTVSRVLIIQTAKIGDLICTTPVFREIKNKYPSSHITALIDPVTRELIEHNPNVDEIINIRKSDISGFAGKIKLSVLICRGGYDTAICLNPNVPYAIALFLGLVPVRLSVMPDYTGNSFKLASVFFTELEKHERGQMTVGSYMKMLSSIGINSNDLSKEIYRSSGSDEKVESMLEHFRGPFIGVGISSGNKMKELGTEKIAALINILVDNTDRHIILVGSKHDVESANKIFALVGKRDRIVNTAGTLSLSELPALLERLSLYIGVDSGITYMADSLLVPLINIAGPSDMQDQRPTGDQTVIIQKKLACVPCSHTFKSPYTCRLGTRECIADVSADEIYSAAINIISGDND